MVFSSESVCSGAFDIHFGHGCPWVSVDVRGLDGCRLSWDGVVLGEELLFSALVAFMFYCTVLFVLKL